MSYWLNCLCQTSRNFNSKVLCECWPWIAMILFHSFNLYHYYYCCCCCCCCCYYLMHSFYTTTEYQGHSKKKFYWRFQGWSCNFPRINSKYYENKVKIKKKIITIILRGEKNVTFGLITLEDIIETILGTPIMDETDNIASLRRYARQRWDKRLKGSPKQPQSE